MIKINLAARKQALTSADPGASKSGGLSKLNIDFSSIKGLNVKRLVIPVLVAGLAYYFEGSYKDSLVEAAQTQMTQAFAKRSKLQIEAGKLKGYESLKKQMDEDEFTIRTKIETIQKLITDRTAPPKALMSLATAIPKEVWLSSFTMSGGKMEIKGYSAGYVQVSDFMKNLNESVYFSGVQLKSSQQIKDDHAQELAQFELGAEKR